MEAANQGIEGMVTVWDAEGSYLGCMGVETWERLLRDLADREDEWELADHDRDQADGMDGRARGVVGNLNDVADGGMRTQRPDATDWLQPAPLVADGRGGRTGRRAAEDAPSVPLYGRPPWSLRRMRPTRRPSHPRIGDSMKSGPRTTLEFRGR